MGLGLPSGVTSFILLSSLTLALLMPQWQVAKAVAWLSILVRGTFPSSWLHPSLEAGLLYILQ